MMLDVLMVEGIGDNDILTAVELESKWSNFTDKTKKYEIRIVEIFLEDTLLVVKG